MKLRYLILSRLKSWRRRILPKGSDLEMEALQIRRTEYYKYFAKDENGHFCRGVVVPEGGRAAWLQQRLKAREEAKGHCFLKLNTQKNKGVSQPFYGAWSSKLSYQIANDCHPANSCRVPGLPFDTQEASALRLYRN